MVVLLGVFSRSAFRPSFPSLIFHNSINTITDLFPVWGTPGG